MNRSPSTTLLGLLLLAAGIVGLIVSLDGSIEAAPAEGVVVIHDGRRIHFEGDFDSAEFERQLESTLESALEGLEDLDLGHLEGLESLEHLDGLEHLEGLGEHLSRALEHVFDDLDRHVDVDVHGHSEIDLDFGRLERHMEKLGRRLERDLGRIHTHGDVDLEWDRDHGERSLRREIRRLERELEQLREELTEIDEDEEI